MDIPTRSDMVRPILTMLNDDGEEVHRKRVTEVLADLFASTDDEKKALLETTRFGRSTMPSKKRFRPYPPTYKVAKTRAFTFAAAVACALEVCAGAQRGKSDNP